MIKILAYLIFAAFFGLMFFVRANKNQVFILYILYSFLFLHVRVVPEFSLFDVVVYMFFLIFYKKRDQTAKGINLFALLLGIYMLVVFVGLLQAEVGFGNANYFEIIRIFPVFIFSRIFIDECIADELFLEKVIKGCQLILLMALIFLGIQMIIGVEFRLFPGMAPNILIHDAIRYPGIFSDPQQFSQFLGVFSYLSMLQFSKQSKRKPFVYIIVICAILGILAAGGRAGLMGWLIGVVLLLLFSKFKVKMGIAIVAIVIGSLAMLFQDSLSIFKRSSDLQETYDFRKSIWDEAIQISKQHALFGIGLKNYQPYVGIYNPNQTWELDDELQAFDQPESGYLKILTEVGIIGFLSLMLMLIVPLIQSFINFFKFKDINFILCISALIAWGVGFYSTYSFHEVRIRLFVAMAISFMVIGNHIHKSSLQEIEEDEIPPLEEENSFHVKA